MKTRIYLFILALLLGGRQVAAQHNNFAERFYAGKQQFENAFYSYVDSINLKFAEYLANNWELFKVELPLLPPSKPGTTELPVYVPNDEPATETVIVETPEQIDTTRIESAPQKNDIKTYEAGEISTTNIYFFGTPLVILSAKSYNIKLSGIKEKQVSEFWAQLSKIDYAPFIADLNKKRANLKLGDWGMYRLILEWANIIYSKQQENEKAIFIVYMLNQAGYKAKLGRANDKLLVMSAFHNNIYGKTYIRFGSDRYYIFSDQLDANVPVASYRLNSESAISRIDLRMQVLPTLAENTHVVKRRFKGEVYSFKCNKNLVDYYNTFPQTDLSIYANVPFSAVAEESITKELARDLQNKTDAKKLRFLLAFIQTGFEYKTDKEQFGYEKFFFPEESLFYPYSDCEDRAMLFCRMVKFCCKLDTILIDYMGHVAAAVKSDEPGDAIIYNNNRHIVCDPSFIGAPIGKTMERHDNAKAKIVPVK